MGFILELIIANTLTKSAAPPVLVLNAQSISPQAEPKVLIGIADGRQKKSTDNTSDIDVFTQKIKAYIFQRNLNRVEAEKLLASQKIVIGASSKSKTLQQPFA